MEYHDYTYYGKAREIARHLLQYPKFLLLFITFVIAYLLFTGRDYGPLYDFIIGSGYFGIFLAGCLFTYGFTAAPATVIFLILSSHRNIYLASFVGGLGALAMDLILFSFIRHSFDDEIKKLSNERLVAYLKHLTPGTIKRYFLPVIGGFIIASPLPDEIGIPLIAASRTISIKAFTIMSYVLNTAGIFVILLVGKSI